MIQIEMSESDATALREVLETCLSDLRMEIADTDRMEFREMLKSRKEAIQNVLARLGREP